MTHISEDHKINVKCSFNSDCLQYNLLSAKVISSISYQNAGKNRIFVGNVPVSLKILLISEVMENSLRYISINPRLSKRRKFILSKLIIYVRPLCFRIYIS